MPSHVLSYATADAHDFADRLVAALAAGSPPLPLVLAPDQRSDPATIRDCASLLLVLTPSCADDDAPCAQAWKLALRYHKPISLLLPDARIGVATRFQSRRPIDFTTFERGLAQLRARLHQLATPKGQLQALKERLTDAERDLREQPERTQARLALLKEQIEQQQRVADDPQRAAKRAGIDIERQIERERLRSLPTVDDERAEADNVEALSVSAAAKLLRSLDADQALGLHDASDEQLAELVERTSGDPATLAALVAVLAVDRATTLAELLAELPALPAAELHEWLLDEVLARLDPALRQIVHALAIYGRPVSANAVEYLLLPYQLPIKSAPLLKHAISLGIVQQPNEQFRLVPRFHSSALGQIPRGEPADRSAKAAPRYTQYALRQRAADYFKRARLPEKNWQRLEDLTPPLAEFAQRLAGEDYEAAASVLLLIGPTLSALGEQRRLIQLNQQLNGKLDDYRLALLTSDQLAAAHQSLDEHATALDYHQRSLALARQHDDRAGEGISLGNLGQYWLRLGQPGKAMEQLKPALNIARETKDQHATQARLLGLGLCAKELGATEQALDYDEQALNIARKLGDKGSESVILGNLGLCYGDLGQSSKALDYLKQAQATARAVGARGGEGTTLVNQAIILIDEKRYAEAEQHTEHSARIAAEIASPRLSAFSHRFRALALLLSGDRAGARAAAEEALRHQSPEHTWSVLLLLGLALLPTDPEAACEHFTTAMSEADALLRHTPELFKALDAKALALAGLAVIKGPHHIPQAIAAFRAARSINRDAGIVARTLRLLELLPPGKAGSLDELRAAAAGT